MLCLPFSRWTLSACALTAFSLFLCGPAATARAATTYYVDFEGGDDAAAGTSPEQAFRRAPGDPQAEGEAAGVALQPGDTVIFKGGVAYRGVLEIGWAGEPDAPITYDGNTEGTFGEGRAILDGSEPLTGWRRCASAEEAGGHPDYESIYVTEVEPEDDLSPTSLGLVQAGRMLYPSQYPNPEDEFYRDRVGTDYLEADGEMTHTSITDSRLGGIGGEQLVGALACVFVTGNDVRWRRITGYDPETHTIHTEALDRDPAGRFAIANTLAASAFDSPGEYVLEEKPPGRRQAEIVTSDLYPNSSHPYTLMLDGRNTFAIIDPMADARLDFIVPGEPLTVDRLSITTDRRTTRPRDIAFLADGEEILTAELPNAQDDFGFELEEPVTFGKLTLEIRTVHEGDHRYGGIRRVQAFDADGRDMLGALEEEDVDFDGPRLYVRPHADPEQEPISRVVRRLAIDLGRGGSDHITIRGFTVRDYRLAMRAREVEGLRVRDNAFERMRQGGYANAIQVNRVKDVAFEGNRFEFFPQMRAIVTHTGKGVTYSGNRIDHVGRSPLVFYFVDPGSIVGNTITHCTGMHSNAITVYEESKNILVAENLVRDSDRPMTASRVNNIVIRNNVFDSGGRTQPISFWQEVSGEVLVENNTLVNSGRDSGLYVGGLGDRDGSTFDMEMVFRNNIMDGPVMHIMRGTDPLWTRNVDRRNNIYLSAPEGFEPGPGEKVIDDTGALFVDFSGRDFRLRPDSPAINAGLAVEHEHDISGNPRPQGPAPDIGAYEFVPDAR